MSAHWIDQFEGLRGLPAGIREDLEAGSKIVHLPQGTTVFAPGQPSENLLLMLEGTVRVQQRSDTGREVFLYRVHAGESCVLTTACMLADEAFSADGIAETDITAVAIPRALFDTLAGRSSEFRQFVFRTFSRRITDLFSLIDDIVFRRLDVRLAERLIERAEGDRVMATHQMLATELGTAREVITRTLAEFQRRGWIEQARGRITLRDPPALERLARASRA